MPRLHRVFWSAVSILISATLCAVATFLLSSFSKPYPRSNFNNAYWEFTGRTCDVGWRGFGLELTRIYSTSDVVDLVSVWYQGQGFRLNEFYDAPIVVRWMDENKSYQQQSGLGQFNVLQYVTAVDRSSSTEVRLSSEFYVCFAFWTV